MTTDPLLTDDLFTLLRAFPNDALQGLVGILKRHTSWSPFAAPRAYDAHALPEGADFTRHATAIGQEILWWGSNDLHWQFGEERPWCEIVTRTAAQIGVPEDERGTGLPAWKVEDAILRKALKDWEELTPEQREEALRKAGLNIDAAKGGALAAAGGLARLGGQQLLTFLAARGAGYALAATIFAPVATALGALWAVYDLAGPGYRVLRPVVLTIGHTRRRLREERAASAFED